jgi:hypothetical protein
MNTLEDAALAPFNLNVGYRFLSGLALEHAAQEGSGRFETDHLLENRAGIEA